MRWTHAVSLTLAAVFLCGEVGDVMAQQVKPQGVARRKSWETGFRMRVGADYDNNVFRLTEGRKAALDGEGQYDDMNEAFDMIGTAEAALTFRGPGFGGRKLSIAPGVAVEAYVFNPRRTHVDLGIGIGQSLTKRDAVRFNLGYAPSVYRRNYLAGADRSYAAGVYSETRGRVTYERELSTSTDAELGVLFQQRRFDALPWRDRDDFGGRAGLRFRLTRAFRMQLDGTVTRQSFNSQPEPVFMNAGIVVVPLMRDRKEYQVGIEPRIRLGDNSALEGRYEYMKRDFDAELQQDPVYGGRADNRHSYRAELQLPYGRRFDLRLGAEFQEQSTSRPTRGQDDDEMDYRRWIGFVRLEFQR